MAAFSFPLALYKGAAFVVPSLVSWPATSAHRKQGADPARLSERLTGLSDIPRPEGKLFWFHAASVGEVSGIIDLARDLCAQEGATLLLTTFTKTGGEAALARGPRGMIHCYLPADTPRATRQFLDHWRPDLAVFTESDLWPVLMSAVKRRGIPAALMNVRPSRSRAKWPRLMAAIMGQFDLLTTQTTGVADELVKLGLNPSKVHVTGDTKAMAAPLPADPQELEYLHNLLKNRRFWVAASTHPDDEAPVLAAHARARAAIPDLLLILLPRHPTRGEAIAATHPAPRRSLSALPDATDPLWIADTLGETGLFYRLAPLVFLGGSFGQEGGHNPYEPALLGAAVLTGPHFANQAQAFDDLITAGAAKITPDADTLGDTVAALLQSADLADMRKAATTYMQNMAAERERPRALLHQLMERAA